MSLNPGLIEFLQYYRGRSVTHLNECKRSLYGKNNDLVNKPANYKNQLAAIKWHISLMDWCLDVADAKVYEGQLYRKRPDEWD